MEINYVVKLVSRNEKGTFSAVDDTFSTILYTGKNQSDAYEFGVKSSENMILINKYVEDVLIRQVFINSYDDLIIFYDKTSELKKEKSKSATNVEEIENQIRLYTELIDKEHEESWNLPKRSQNKL